MRSPDAGVITHRTGRPSRIGAARLLALARPGARNARWATGNSAVIMIRRSCWRKLPRTRAADACPPPAHAERARCSPCSGRRTCAGRPDSGSPWPLYFTMEARFYWRSSGAGRWPDRDRERADDSSSRSDHRAGGASQAARGLLILSQAHQPLARPVQQLGVGREHHCLRLHRGVDHLCMISETFSHWCPLSVCMSPRRNS
jgi:hypothetical protein